MEPILDYGNVCLRREDYDTLDDSCWLNDAIIDFIYEYCERNLDPNIPPNAICFLRPGMMQLLAALSDQMELESVLPATFFTADILFMPINDSEGSIAGGGSHWSLLVFSRSDCTFRYYDSLCALNLPFANRMALKVRRTLGIVDCDFFEMDSPQQTNGADCGIWVLIITLSLVDRITEAILDGTILADEDWEMEAGDLPDPCKERLRIKGFIETLSNNACGDVENFTEENA